MSFHRALKKLARPSFWRCVRAASCLYFDSEISTRKEEKQRINILPAHGENRNYSHAKLAKWLNVVKSTVTNVIKVFGERLLTARKAGSGGNRKAEATTTTKRVARCFEWNPNLSVRDVAKKLRVAPSTVHRAKKRAGLSIYKKVVTLNRNDKQSTIAEVVHDDADEVWRSTGRWNLRQGRL